VENPEKPYEYRPTSLVGSLYKMISKILENRLKKVLKQVIDAK